MLAACSANYLVNYAKLGITAPSRFHVLLFSNKHLFLFPSFGLFLPSMHYRLVNYILLLEFWNLISFVKFSLAGRAIREA